MSRFTIQAFFKQFFFLLTGSDPIVPNTEIVEKVAVSRIDQDFLSLTPWYRGATGSLVDISDGERIFLLGKEGNLLVEVEQSRSVTHNEAHCDNEHYDGETVGEALLRLDPEQVCYAVVVHTGYEVRNYCSVGGYSVTLYKPPKGFTLRGWVKEQEFRAQQQIKTMIALVNSEA